jgi:hypothetical protein
MNLVKIVLSGLPFKEKASSAGWREAIRLPMAQAAGASSAVHANVDGSR